MIIESQKGKPKMTMTQKEIEARIDALEIECDGIGEEDNKELMMLRLALRLITGRA
jgi:hypothetical protein